MKVISCLAMLAAPAVALIEMHGSGTTNPSKFFWEVNDIFAARAKPGVKMSYRAVGSSTGQMEFIGEANEPAFTPYSQDFGSGDIPITASNYEKLQAENIEVMHFPFQIGAMSFFHNVPQATHSGDLKLTACLLARIFSRDIQTWDHPDILAENPTLRVEAGQAIHVYHRVHGSSTTAGITTYLNAACPSVWTAEMVGSTVDWAEGTFGAQGSGGMSSQISSNDFSIGYIDAGHGHDDKLSEIQLANAAGIYRTSLEAAEVDGVQNAAAAALAQGVLPSDPSADFSKVSLHNMLGEDVWPIVAVSYVYLRKDQTGKGETACLLKAFLDFVLGEGQTMLHKYNFVPVPDTVKAVAQAAIDNMDLPACTQWSFETSTQKGAGQLDYVISGKRRSFGEYDRANIEADLLAVIDALKLEINDQHVAMQTEATPSDDSEPVAAAPQNGMALAALLVALAALCVAVAAYYKTVQAEKQHAEYAMVSKGEEKTSATTSV